MLTPGAATLRESLSQSVRSLFKRKPSSESREFWALRDISLEIKPGERVGVIGRNGAGKTTLLKLMSRITEPTTGKIHLRGRVSSLLEVGTGFHPELTGRENIYLNGALLGMSRAEIHRKFDEIVAFSEIERFIDTPVKRYSSGMYVRLAFAVAAHLDPDILLVDEVLAVGDVKFQQKCLGKMRDVSAQGRTLLFVTHQMGIVAQLCERAILLDQGRCVQMGNTQDIVMAYLRGASEGGSQLRERRREDIEGRAMYVQGISLLTAKETPASEYGIADPVSIRVGIAIAERRSGAVMGLVIKDRLGRKIFTAETRLNADSLPARAKALTGQLVIPAHYLTPGEYSLHVALHIPNVEVLDVLDEVCRFSIVDTGSEMALYEGADYGCVFPPCQWTLSHTV